MKDSLFEFVPVKHNPFTGPEILCVVPTIEPQKEIWLSCKMGGDDSNRSYNESITVCLKGKLNRFAIANALKYLVSRHESLRAGFSPDGLNMIIYRDAIIDLVFDDISSFDDAAKQRFLESYADKDASTAFDLKNGPLLRPALFKLDEDTYHLRVTAHHIICDGWSMGVIINELSKLYSAYSKNEIPVINAAPAYSDYATYQLNLSYTEEHKVTENYWVKQFRPLPQVMNLPVDFQRPAIRTFKSRRDDFKIDRSLVADVKKMGAKAGCSFVTTMLAAFEVLLHHVTGQDDIVLGLPAAGQSATGSDNLIGHCVNLLPLRSFPVDNIKFDEYLKIRKKAIFDAYDQQQFTFGSLLKKLPLSRDMSRVPLVPVVFNIDTAMNTGVNFEGLKHKLISNPRAFETFEIFLNITGNENELILEWSYNTQLFAAGTISGMMEHFENILRTVVERPSVKIGDLKVKFRFRAPFEYPGNDTVFEYPRIPLHDLIRKQCLKSPAAPAIAFGKKVVSYEQLETLSNQFAFQLSEAGVKTGDIVGLAIERSPYIIISMLAILKTGAAYVPLDPEYPRDRVSYMLEDSAAKILLTSARYQGQFNSGIKELLVEDLVKECPQYPVEFSRSGITENAIAYILYTSGSTGRPKGVQVTHSNLVNLMSSLREILKVNATDSILGLTTVSFDISALEFYLPLTSGASVELVGTEIARDGYALLNMIKDRKPAFVQATPATWKMLLEAGWNEDIKIRCICSGGEALSRELAEKLIPRSNFLYNLYGPTETTIYSTWKHVTIDDKVISIGKPVGNTRVYILNADSEPVRENEQGEIYISGDGVAKGYLNQAELTRERFLNDPFSKEPGVKMYRTGDLGKFLANGEIQCLGRIDQQIKVRGYRIEPGEIEYCLSKQSTVRESVVVAREDNPGDQRLVAYVVPVPGINEDVDQLISQWKQAIKNFMPAYMCPGDFVILDKLPMTPNGKVDKKGLPKPHRTKAIGADNNQSLTPSEKALSDIWSKILGIPQPNIHDDFFESGGHSLIAMKLMDMIEKETGIQLPLSVLFECPTIALLAAKLENKNRAKVFDSLVTIKKGGDKMPLYIVHGARGTVPIFNRTIEYLHPDQPIYGLQARGLDGNTPIIETVEELAKNYIAEIIENNPDGPYALAGYSFGGIVAFEMARQLQQMNKEVKALIIFDTYADGADVSRSPFVSVLNKIRIFTMRKFFDVTALIRNPVEKIRYEKEGIKTRMHKPYRRLKGWIEGKEKDLFFYKYKIEQTNLKAQSRYRLQSYNGVIELFRATKRTYFLDDSLYLGWKKYASKGVRVHEIPGEHNSIFLPPNVNELARKLQLCLDSSVREEPREITLFYQKRMLEAV